jgi:hypothetical protein
MVKENQRERTRKDQLTGTVATKRPGGAFHRSGFSVPRLGVRYEDATLMSVPHGAGGCSRPDL